MGRLSTAGCLHQKGPSPTEESVWGSWVTDLSEELGAHEDELQSPEGHLEVVRK